MIHYENMTKDRIISLLKDTLEYAEEKDKEIERLTKQNKALNEMYELTKKEYIRLNNIINELESWLEEKSQEYRFYDEHNKADTLDIALDKLQELKGSESNE